MHSRPSVPPSKTKLDEFLDMWQVILGVLFFWMLFTYLLPNIELENIKSRFCRCLFRRNGAILCAMLFSAVGAVLTGIGTNDPTACVNTQKAGIVGTVYTGMGIILAAFASYDFANQSCWDWFELQNSEGDSGVRIKRMS